MTRPAAGTCLFGITHTMPVGGSAVASQHTALDMMPTFARASEGLQAIHSARANYAPQGSANDRTQHGYPLGDEALEAVTSAVRAHPGNGPQEPVRAEYIISFDRTDDARGCRC
ncbi:hypothetical protein OVY29_05265 [Sphingopyxis sp. SE2]|uniref:hypothetical protein n=1 Tax=Sphingopyxis sp. SE2 TaxID=1586240 RepID=UPI0028C1108F|nr:hypothetical protein [Sphingopyxis sp. SE2]MDT7528068.1 hypothetical protein [Sphingopyxis sp. SE2]